ncbi:MAG: PIN domain-containing protein [Candidatus Acidiferrum sp.]
MPAAEFLDTNILVYAYDASDPRKQFIAQELTRRALAGEFLISVQVLSEFASTMLHKISPPATAEQLVSILDALAPIKTISPDQETVRRAVEARSAYGLHFYDAMIIASAEQAACKCIWSEDLNPSQQYFGVKVENPFAK